MIYSLWPVMQQIHKQIFIWRVQSMNNSVLAEQQNRSFQNIWDMKKLLKKAQIVKSSEKPKRDVTQP